MKRRKTDDSSSPLLEALDDKLTASGLRVSVIGVPRTTGAFEQEEDAARAHDEARVRYGKKAGNFPASDDEEAEFCWRQSRGA